MDAILELVTGFVGWAIYGPEDRPRWWAIYTVRFITIAAAVVFVVPPVFGVQVDWPMWFGFVALFVAITVMGAEHWLLGNGRMAMVAVGCLALMIFGLALSEGG